jgi:hypothetical protein
VNKIPNPFFSMDFPSPAATTPSLQRAVVTTNVVISMDRDAVVCHERLQFSGIQEVSDAVKTNEAVLKRNQESQDGTKELYSRPTKKPRHISKMPKVNKDLNTMKQVPPLASSIYDTLARLDKMKGSSRLSDDDERIRRAEISAILEQASAVAFAMGTSTIGETSPSLATGRRRYQRRHSFVIHHNNGGFPHFSVAESPSTPESGDPNAIDMTANPRREIGQSSDRSKKETEVMFRSNESTSTGNDNKVEVATEY